MTSGLHPKLPTALIALFASALAMASFDVARADDQKPGFFKKLSLIHI